MENNNQILAGLEKLLHNKQLSFFDTLKDIALFNDYFTSDFDSEREIELEKVLVTAFIQTINSLDFIPKEIKDSSLYAGRGIIEVFRYIKLDNQLGDKPEDYRKELKESQVAQIAACIEVQIKKVGDVAIPQLIHYISVILQHPIPQENIYIYYNLIVNKLTPQSIKQKVNNVIKETSSVCASMIVAAINGAKDVLGKLKAWIKEKYIEKTHQPHEIETITAKEKQQLQII